MCATKVQNRRIVFLGLLHLFFLLKSYVFNHLRKQSAQIFSLNTWISFFSKFEFSNRVLVAVCQLGGSDLKEVSWIQSGNLRLYAPTTTFQ